jgi:H+/gluconate symporter-like permease
MDTFITALGIIFPVIGTIVVAIIESNAAKARKEAKEREEKAEAKAQLRERESRLSMKMLDATLQLSIVTSNALTGGHNNGNVERAKAAAEAAQIEYHNFLQEIAAHEVSK